MVYDPKTDLIYGIGFISNHFISVNYRNGQINILSKNVPGIEGKEFEKN